MSSRLNQQREAHLTPIRTKKAEEELSNRGFSPKRDIALQAVTFQFKGNQIKYFPYSEWVSGKGIKDGRGLHNLLKQLDEYSRNDATGLGESQS